MAKKPDPTIDPDKIDGLLDCAPYVRAWREAFAAYQKSESKEVKHQIMQVIKHLRKAWSIANGGDDNLGEIADDSG